MPIKVIPGSITEPYKIGQGDFSPNLVGQQFTEGSTLFTLGNFEITTNVKAPLSRTYNTGTFSEPYTLETLNISPQESELLSNQNITTVLNLDPDDLTKYVYFGSFHEYLRTTIEQIIVKWKGSLYVNVYIPTDTTYTPRNTVLNYTYDNINDICTFDVPITTVRNDYGLRFQNDDFTVSNEYGDISNLNNSFKDYQISNVFGDFYILDFTGVTTSSNVLTLSVKGNVWPPLMSSGFGQANYHIRPKEEILNKYFFNLLDEFDNNILNRLTEPQYTVSVQVPTPTDSGLQFLSKIRLTWPTSDGFNLDINGDKYETYITNWLNISKKMDEYKTSLITRRFITHSITEFDTDGGGNPIYGRKVDKLLKIYGREFDEIKKYIDSIEFSRVVTYNKKDNTPDELVKMLASELGMDVLLSFFDNNLFNDVLPENSQQEGYGNINLVPFSGYSRYLSIKEMDLELWRRLVINAWWLFKSKGHRKVLEFFLNLFGIDNCVISLDEYIYIAKERLDVQRTLGLIADYLDLGIDDLSVSDYPMDVYGFPKIPSDSNDWYYQMDGFWYNGGNLSETGNNPHLGPYDYGRSYLSPLECMIEGFDGSISGTTPFNTLDQIFTELDNGNIDNGVQNYGTNFAEIMNSNNMISQNAIVNQAGAIDDFTYGDSPNSLGISFTTDFSGECNVIPCPTQTITYDNGIYFFNELTPNVELTDTNIYSTFFNGDLVSLVEASSLITKECCDELGGYYLAAIIPTHVPSLITPVSLPPSHGNTEYFSVEDIFSTNPLNNPQRDLVCWWCPPVKLLCGQDYYNNVTGSVPSPTGGGRPTQTGTPILDDDTPIFTTRQTTVGEVGGGKGGGGPIVTGCIYQAGTEFIEVDPSSPTGFYRYVINITDPTNPTSLCPSWYTSSWVNSGGGGFGSYTKGCCTANRGVYDPNGGGGNSNDPILDPSGPIGPNCIGNYTILNGNAIIDGNPVPQGCCTESLVGVPVNWNTNTNTCEVMTPPSPCDNSNINITPLGVVQGITTAECCNEQVVGATVNWNGTNCVLEASQCVIVSIDNQNITNPECCSRRGGTISVDNLGNTICTQVVSPNTCPPFELTETTTTNVGGNSVLQIEAVDLNGLPLQQDCCKDYLLEQTGEVFEWDGTKCFRQIPITYDTCRYELIESVFGLNYNNYHPNGDLGINSLSEKLYLTMSKLIINGVDYLQSSATPPQTILNAPQADPNIWNSVLFIQKTLNDYNIDTIKAQLPSTPINITPFGDIPNTEMYPSPNFVAQTGIDSDYGFFIIKPTNTTFEIEIKVYTASENNQPIKLNFKENTMLVNETENNPRYIMPECIYSVTKTYQHPISTCYTVTSDVYGDEPTQCYPFQINGITYE
tara:strand:+ start:19524 stop:23627 length:4104 start_codon:yes stop_codon:yes gene_type:complete